MALIWPAVSLYEGNTLQQCLCILLAIQEGQRNNCIRREMLYSQYIEWSQSACVRVKEIPHELHLCSSQVNNHPYPWNHPYKKKMPWGAWLVFHETTLLLSVVTLAGQPSGYTLLPVALWHGQQGWEDRVFREDFHTRCQRAGTTCLSILVVGQFQSLMQQQGRCASASTAEWAVAHLIPSALSSHRSCAYQEKEESVSVSLTPESPRIKLVQWHGPAKTHLSEFQGVCERKSGVLGWPTWHGAYKGVTIQRLRSFWVVNTDDAL